MSTFTSPRVPVVPLAVLLREAGPRLWRGLPVLVVASLPMVVAVALTAVFALGGAVLLAPAVAAFTIGPAFQLLTTLAGEPVAVRALPRVAAGAYRPGVVRALPVAGVATLACAGLLARDAGPVFAASLAVNLVVLGATLLIAPFAYASGSWRRGAGLTAASPAFVLALLTLVALASGIATLVGPPFLLLLPGVVAVATAAQVHLLTKEFAK
ncbi:hypothetical protein [Cryptosporangium japonicum]|uniref:Integral membrane protein n=1 Tax=Cryptosporangium japonicum TaxID=80872 RepID=A0ABN0UW61_9ACTN